VTTTDLATLEVTATDLQEVKVVVIATDLATLPPLGAMTATDLATPEATAMDLREAREAKVEMIATDQEIMTAPTHTGQETLAARITMVRKIPAAQTTMALETPAAPTTMALETPVAPTPTAHQETTTTHTDPRTRATPKPESFWRRPEVSSDLTNWLTRVSRSVRKLVVMTIPMDLRETPTLMDRRGILTLMDLLDRVATITTTTRGRVVPSEPCGNKVGMGWKRYIVPFLV